MGHKLHVYVLDRDRTPISRVTVRIVIDGFWKGGSLTGRTDGEGHVEFHTAADYESRRSLKIHVQGEIFGSFRIDGGSYTVQLG